MHKLFSHGSIYAFGSILRQLVSFLMLPIYTRYLTPADYGVIGLMIFALSLSELIFGARINQAIPKYYFDFSDENDRKSVISTALLLTAVISTAGVSLLIISSSYVSLGLYGTSEYSLIVTFFSITLLTQAIENYSLLYIRIQQRPWFYIILSFSKLILQLSFNILLVVYLKMGVLGVAISAMSSSCLLAILLGAYTTYNAGYSFNKNLAGKMISFSWPLWLAGFAGLYVGMSNRYYLRIFSSLDDVGLFELAIKFSSIVLVLIWQPFSKFWQVESFRYYQQANAKSIFHNTFEIISTILILSALGISIFADTVITLMADPAFYDASIAVPFLCYSQVFGSLIFFLNFSFLVNEKTGWISRNQYLTALMVTILYLILIPFYGYVGAALSFMIARFLQFFIVLYSSRKLFDMELSVKYLFYKLFLSLLAFSLANYYLNVDNFLLDLSLDVSIYFFSSIIICLPLLRIKKLRTILYEHLPCRRFFYQYN